MNEYLLPLRVELERVKNEANAIPMKKYMKNKFDFVGVQSKPRQDIFNNFFKDQGLPDYKDLPKIVDELWNYNFRDYQYFAIELIDKMRKQWNEDIIFMFEDLIVRKSWWDSVDSIVSRLNTPYFKKYPGKFIAVTSKWNQSENMWLQRASIISQLKFKSQTNEKILESNILNCINSKEFFIQKAIGWALREYSKTNSKFVLQFVAAHELKTLAKRQALKWIATQNEK